MIYIFLILIASPVKLWSQNISEVVGYVDNSVITSRDVKIDWIVESALYNPSNKIKTLPADVTSKEFDKELNRLLMETVVFIESKLFKIVEISPDQTNQTLKKVKDRLNEEHSLTVEWKKLNVLNNELEDVLRRKLQSKGFIEFKAKASLIPVTEAETFNYYKNNRKRFGTKPYKDFKDSIKSFLAKQQADQRLSEWFGVLKKKYQVRKIYVN